MSFRGPSPRPLLVALMMMPLTAWCDDGPLPPRYDSHENVQRSQGNGHFTSPEDHARPGEVFFLRGAYAVTQKEYRFAADMYKAAASWAYKPAEYNLAVMYFNGEGVAADRPLAMAWAALAAERGDQDYVDARESIYASLSADEFARANEIWRELKKTYADDVALKRAKARWADVRNNVTGSHVGSIGHLLVGNSYNTGHLGDTGSVDGSIAYRQLHESDNPYDPKFESHPGTATVGPLVPLPDQHTPAAEPNDDTPRNL